MQGKARLRGLYRIMYSKTTISINTYSTGMQQQQGQEERLPCPISPI
jgi:hypothetical protein